MLEEPGDEGARRVDPPPAMAPHRVDGCPDGAVAPGRGWSRRVVDEVAHATCVTPARDEASGREEVTAVGVVHARSAHEAMLPTPNMTQLSSRVCGMSAVGPKRRTHHIDLMRRLGGDQELRIDVTAVEQV